MITQRQKKVLAVLHSLSDLLTKEGQVAALEHLLNTLNAKDLSALSAGGRRKLLSLLPLSSEAELAKSPRAILSPHEIQARKIVESLVVDKDGFFNLTIPAHFSDIDAMKALVYRKRHPTRICATIPSDYLNWYARQPGVKARDVTQERTIRIIPLVKGTLGKDRSEQEKVLNKAQLTFAAPEELALVVAAYACKTYGNNLIKFRWLRTTVRNNRALATNEKGCLRVVTYHDKDNLAYAGASGVALPATKN
jgi:hypothetical protein